MNPTLEFAHAKLDEEALIKRQKRHLQSTAMVIINVLQVLKTYKSKVLSTLQRNRKFTHDLISQVVRKLSQGLTIWELNYVFSA